MTYLNAYRASASKYGSAGNRLSNLPAPYRPDTRIPGAANDNFPRPANDNLRRPTPPRMPLTPKGMRVLNALKSYRSAIDVFGYSNLEDAFIQRLVGGYTPLNLSGWILQNVCTSLVPTHYTQVSGFCAGPSGSPGVCFTGSIASGAVPIGTPYSSIGCRLTLMRQTGTVLGSPRRTAVSYWWRPTPFSPGAFRRALPRGRPKPVIDPNDLPIRWFGPDPVPLPTVLVPYRPNDPIGSTRNNGDVKPRFVPRRPPEPPREREVKLRATAGVVGVIQRLGHATTELLDHIDSFHDALPKQYQAKGGYVPGLGFRKATPQAKVEAVMKNFDKLNWNDVIKNVAKNEIEDRILGRANAGADRALNRSPIGRITRGFAF